MEAGLNNPLDSYRVRSLMKGVNRVIGAPPKRKLPITPDILLSIHAVLDFSISFNVALWAAMLVAFFTFLRKSSLVPRSVKQFSSKLHLCYSCVEQSRDGCVVSVRHTKTIQCHERVLKIPIPRIEGSVLCPVSSLDCMRKNVPVVHDDMPLFSYLHEGKLTCLTYSTFVKALKHSIAACGYDASLYSGHSFRRGGATYAFSLNIPAELIKLHGDWKSNAYLRYIDISTDLQWKMVNVMSSHLKG